MTEEVTTFGYRQSLVGILTNPHFPTVPQMSPGIIILGAGMVHRVGPNRLSVKIARALGKMGFTTLRFDFSGVGDSSVRQDHLPYHKSVILEAQEAMDVVQSAKGIQRFILLGICSGAMNSFEIAQRDSRVRGIILINPAGGFDRTAKTELADYFSKRKQAQSMTTDKIVNPKNWWRALTGQIDYANLKKILRFQAKRFFFCQKELLPHTERAFEVLAQLVHQDVNIQFVISGGDPQVKNYFGALLLNRLSKREFSEKVLVDIIKHADHTFTSLSSQPQILQVIQNFALKCSRIDKPLPHNQAEAQSAQPDKKNYMAKSAKSISSVNERNCK